MTSPTHYDTIGHGYTRTRQEDPELRTRLHRALGEAQSVVNVGAGAGSYEPTDRYVIAIEPSDVMAAQRPAKLAPAIRAGAADLPLRDNSVDAAMAVVSLHHWDNREQGVRELRRVARGPVVVLTYDAQVSGRMWLMADYMPETAEFDRQTFTPPHQIGNWLGGDYSIESIPVARECKDWMLGSFWAHPERVLDPVARAGTSGFARLDPQVQTRVVSEVKRDLRSGTWDERHGELRRLTEYDAGLRLIVSPGG